MLKAVVTADVDADYNLLPERLLYGLFMDVFPYGPHRIATETEKKVRLIFFTTDDEIF